MKFKKSTSTALLLLISLVTVAQNLKKVETYYDPFTKTRIDEAYTTLTIPPYPIQGVYKEWDQSGVLMTEANFSSGKKHGAYKVFYNTGMRDLVGKENIGKLYTVSNYNNDQPNGLEQMYTYLKGRPQVILQKTWVNGDATKQEEWYDDGKPKSVSVINGLAITWYPNGQKEAETTIKNGVVDGKTTEWYENGKIRYSATMKGQCQVGEATAYFEDGTVAKKMNFDPATCKDMHTIQYYRNGKVKWERIGQNGTYTVTNYDSLLGYKKSVQARVDDPRNPNGDLLLHGKSTEFASDGSIIEEITYEYGQANGEVKTTDSDGTVVLQGMMSRGAKVGEWLYYLKNDGSKTNKVKEAAFFRKINYKSGNAPFLYTDYYLTGEKLTVSYFLEEWPDKNVNFINRFYKNGQKMEEGTFGYSKMSNNYEGRTGEWKTYYENGQLKSRGSYRVNDPVGTWEFYDEKGNLTETKNY